MPLHTQLHTSHATRVPQPAHPEPATAATSRTLQTAAAHAPSACVYPQATSRLCIDSMVDATSRSCGRAYAGVARAGRAGGRVYGEAERRLLPARLLAWRAGVKDWRARAALQVLSAFLVSLSLGLIVLNVAVVADVPQAAAAPMAPQARAAAPADIALTALPSAPTPHQGFVAQAMGRYSAMLPRPVQSADVSMALHAVDSGSVDSVAQAPSRAEVRRRYQRVRAIFEAQNDVPAEVLAESSRRADEAARVLAARTRPALDAAPLPPPAPVSDPANVSAVRYDAAAVGMGAPGAP